MSQVYLTKDKYEELLQELNDLKVNKSRAIAERLEFAKSLGDLSENYEYHAAREEQLALEERIGQLENVLKNSEVVNQTRHSAAVGVGATLRVKKEPAGPTQEFIIVGAEEANLDAGKISYESPLGASLLGKKKGETVIVSVPRGEVKYKILDVK